jgi:hypothetical protein
VVLQHVTQPVLHRLERRPVQQRHTTPTAVAGLHLAARAAGQRGEDGHLARAAAELHAAHGEAQVANVVHQHLDAQRRPGGHAHHGVVPCEEGVAGVSLPASALGREASVASAPSDGGVRHREESGGE